MTNKNLIFFLIFFHLITFNLYGNEQISFDVTEIEILDGGNKIIGKNRGIINSNDGITVEADEFEYDKIKNILKAKGNISIIDQTNNYNFSGQNIIYNWYFIQFKICFKFITIFNPYRILCPCRLIMFMFKR